MNIQMWGLSWMVLYCTVQTEVAHKHLGQGCHFYAEFKWIKVMPLEQEDVETWETTSVTGTKWEKTDLWISAAKYEEKRNAGV